MVLIVASDQSRPPPMRSATSLAVSGASLPHKTSITSSSASLMRISTQPFDYRRRRIDYACKQPWLRPDGPVSGFFTTAGRVVDGWQKKSAENYHSCELARALLH